MKRKSWWKVLVAVGALLLFMLPAIPALALVFANPGVITSGISLTDGISSSAYRDTWDTENRHWIMYLNDDADLCYYSVLSDGSGIVGTTIVSSTGLFSPEFGSWYDDTTNTIHYARHNMTGSPDSVVYRMGTPSDTTGAITWAAAEQTVSTVPAQLLTWRTNIVVDEGGYPWVMWVDTDNVTPNMGKLYIRGSSTKDGTWTTDATRTADNVSQNSTGHVWFAQCSPIDNVADRMEVEWSEETTTNTTGLYAMTYNGTGWESVDIIADTGNMTETRPDAFSCYDHGSAIWATYTGSDGAIYARARSSIQTWNATAVAVSIKDAGTTLNRPSLSGYRLNSGGAGEELLCIVSNNDTLSYSIHTFGDEVNIWGIWTTIWTVPDTSTYNITRHVANYKYGSPISFAWQVTRPDGDAVYGWWIENTNDTLGYYTGDTVSTLAGTSIFTSLAIVAILVGVVIILIEALMGVLTVEALLFTGIGVFLVYYVVTTLINLLF
ncbi:hypothetical protein M0R04_08230 [Candidatus Dojkabacteria bacterium]|jgi:hypothetical protein|nr:hypothetical protein [Candidatus Dojkabacteria bacterium]